jgi:two-component system sensor histidine kinase/response regulator
MGARVTLAANGQDALNQLQDAPEPLPFDLVLMDLQMPVMDGHQATLALRQQMRFKDIPIIALTAHASAQEAARCLAEGMNAHLTKPIDPDALFNCLQQWGQNFESKKSALAHVIKKDEAIQNVANESSQLAIPGIDVTRGLSRCAGNEALYRALLVKFLQSIQDFPAQMQSALEQGRLEVAQRIAHSLRGVAANIGATQCSSLSASLEEFLAGGLSGIDVQSPLLTLQAHLEQLAAALSPILEAGTPTLTSNQPFHLEELRQVLQVLAGLLRTNNFEAEQLLQVQGALLQAGLGVSFVELKRQVANFDFAQALDTLQSAATAADIHLN